MKKYILHIICVVLISNLSYGQQTSCGYVDINTINTTAANNSFLSFIDPVYDDVNNQYVDLNLVKVEAYIQLSYNHDGLQAVPGDFSLELSVDFECKKNGDAQVFNYPNQTLEINFDPAAGASYQDIYLIRLEDVVKVDVLLNSFNFNSSANTSISDVTNMITLSVCVKKEFYSDYLIQI